MILLIEFRPSIENFSSIVLSLSNDSRESIRLFELNFNTTYPANNKRRLNYFEERVTLYRLIVFGNKFFFYLSKKFNFSSE